MRILGIDPGNDTGIALLNNGNIIFCDVFSLAKERETRDTYRAIAECCCPIDRAIIEFPRVYHRKNWKGDPNNLLVLAEKAGYLHLYCELLNIPKIEYVYPYQWKGQQPKEINHKLIYDQFDADNRKIIDSMTRRRKSRAHNAIDALGLALFGSKK